MSHYYAKFKENPCMGTDASTPLRRFIEFNNCFDLFVHFSWFEKTKYKNVCYDVHYEFREFEYKMQMTRLNIKKSCFNL